MGKFFKLEPGERGQKNFYDFFCVRDFVYVNAETLFYSFIVCNYADGT